MHTHERSRLRFGPFELDVGSRELQSPSGRVRLQEQPFVILQLLLERPGQVVTREELRQRLWPDGTFVDFEHSLNAAVKRLRSALKDDADNPRFVETIPRRGYRLVVDPEEAETPHLSMTTARARLAVMPFTEIGGQSPDDDFRHGFTEEMISELGRRCRGQLAVIASHSSMAFENTAARACDIGVALRADYLLEGSIRRNGGRVRITARLVDTRSETQLWVDTYEEPLTDWLSAQAEIAAHIAHSMTIELMPADRPATYSPHPGAHQSYLKGRYHYQRLADSGARQALHFFQDAVTRDPEFAAAHAGVAMVEVMSAAYYHEVPRRALERARGSAERALQLDASVAEAHQAVGDVKRLLLWDPHGARFAYTTAIALNPSLESARTAYARLLLSLGRFAQAIREADVARELDPHCLTANSVAAWARYAAGDYDAAAELCRHTLELDERHVGARQLLGAALLTAGSLKEAIRVLEWGVNLPDPNPIAVVSLSYARAMTNSRSEAADLLASVEKVANRRYVSPYHLAIAYAGLGEVDRAFQALATACDDRDPFVTNVAIDPRLTPLRTDPRYTSLLVQLELHDFHRQ